MAVDGEGRPVAIVPSRQHIIGSQPGLLPACRSSTPCFAGTALTRVKHAERLDRSPEKLDSIRAAPQHVESVGSSARTCCATKSRVGPDSLVRTPSISASARSLPTPWGAGRSRPDDGLQDVVARVQARPASLHGCTPLTILVAPSATRAARSRMRFTAFPHRASLCSTRKGIRDVHEAIWRRLRQIIAVASRHF